MDTQNNPVTVVPMSESGLRFIYNNITLFQTKWNLCAFLSSLKHAFYRIWNTTNL